MRRAVLDGWRAETEFRTLLASLRDYYQRGPSLDRKLLMALQKDVQDMIDAVTQNTSAVKSAEAGLQVLQKKIEDQGAIIAGLQAGQVITADDLAALRASTGVLKDTTNELLTAIPANTPEGPKVAPSGTLDDQGNPVAPNTAANPAP